MATLAEIEADLAVREAEQGRAPRDAQAAADAPDAAMRRAHAHASRLPASVEGHGGDGALWDAARELAAFGLSEADVLLVLRDTFNPRCTPPWDEHALTWKAKRAVERYREVRSAISDTRRIQGEIERMSAVLLPEQVRTSADAEFGAPATDVTDDVGITWGNIDENPPPRNYRVKEFEWGPGRPLGLLAGYNASKTLTSKQILVDYVMDVPVLGHFTIGAWGSGRVLDLCYEQFSKAQMTYTRLARAAGADLDALNHVLKFGRPSWFLSDGMGRPRDEELMHGTEELLKHLCDGFDICSVDPYGAASLGIDENSSAIQEPARMLERVSEATGCAFMICVHRGRDDEAEHARGHSSLDDAFDTTILISKHDEKAPNERLFKCLKRPMYGFQPEIMRIEDVGEDGNEWNGTGEESWGVRVRRKGAAPKAVVNVKEAHLEKVLTMLTKHRQTWHTARAIRDNPMVQLNSANVGAALGLGVERGLIQSRRKVKGEGYEYTCGQSEAPVATAALTRAQSRYAGIRT